MFHVASCTPKPAVSLGLCLTAASLAGIPAAVLRADTVFESGTTTIGSGTDFGTILSVGHSGTATMRVVDGAKASNDDAFIGHAPGSFGTAIVTGGTWTTRGGLVVGSSGTGTLTMSGGLVIVGGTLTKGGQGTINLDPGGALQIGTGGGTGRLGVSSITDNGTLIFDRATDDVFSGAVSGSGTIVKRGPGMLSLTGSIAVSGPTVIRQGAVQLAHATALPTSTISRLAGGTLSLTAALRTTVGGLDPGAGGLVDVGNGGVTVASALSPAELVAAIVSGRADGSWSGTSGITSSVAASDVAGSTLRGVGWLDNGDGSVSVAYAAPGDTNLDWIIDVLDAANVVASGKYSSGLPATWSDGDFNYDGIVDILDASEFVATGLYNMGLYNAAEIHAPEPTGRLSAGVCLAALWAAGRWRRRPW